MFERTHKIAIVGCGFVADLYVSAIEHHPRLEIASIYDISESRQKAFGDYHNIKPVSTYQEILEDQEISLIVNLTSPHSHYEVSLAALKAGKHVYSEKPLATDFDDARNLVSFAKEHGLHISSAPCTLIGNTAQSIWGAIETGAIGEVYTIYAEIDDGLVSKMPVDKWQSPSGIPWPFENEFEVGCILEHSSYYLSWMIAIFGPVKELVSYGDVLIPEKMKSANRKEQGADFSVGILKFESGPVMRLTTSITSPKNHGLLISGSEGALESDEIWNMQRSAYLRSYHKIRRKLFLSPIRRKIRYTSSMEFADIKLLGNSIDFASGIVEMLESINSGRTPYISDEFCLHVTEISLALSRKSGGNGIYRPSSTFKPLVSRYI